jgi:hypothetical protein
LRNTLHLLCADFARQSPILSDAFRVYHENRSMTGRILAIAWGGLAAGAFDLTSAFITFGWRVPRAIASGLLGTSATQGGTGMWLLGVFLHFFIAFSAAAIYCVTSWRLEFLRKHFLVCGPFYGIAVYLVMSLVVVPLSAAPFKSNSITHAALIQGLLVHMVLIGLPIAFCADRFTR